MKAKQQKRKKTRKTPAGSPLAKRQAGLRKIRPDKLSSIVTALDDGIDPAAIEERLAAQTRRNPRTPKTWGAEEVEGAKVMKEARKLQHDKAVDRMLADLSKRNLPVEQRVEKIHEILTPALADEAISDRPAAFVLHRIKRADPDAYKAYLAEASAGGLNFVMQEGSSGSKSDRGISSLIRAQLTEAIRPKSVGHHILIDLAAHHYGLARRLERRAEHVSANSKGGATAYAKLVAGAQASDRMFIAVINALAGRQKPHIQAGVVNIAERLAVQVNSEQPGEFPGRIGRGRRGLLTEEAAEPVGKDLGKKTSEVS